MSVASPTLPRRAVPSRSAEGPKDRALGLAWGALALLLLVNLPAFLCMGLDSDISMYDLIARRLLRGDVPYRDLLETNFPGIVWLHMAVRSLLGWRSEGLRAVDFAVVTSSAWLLSRWLPRSCAAWRRVALVGGLLAFYLSTSEWCHCQRDTWMLLPALLALRLRVAQAERLTHVGASMAVVGWAMLEGIVWGAAFWIKPFVAAPAAVCWLLAAWHARGAVSQSSGRYRRLAVDFAGLLVGGLLVGGIGASWLVARDAWPAFVEVMFVWNREYFAFNVLGSDPWAPLLGFVVRLFPWVLVHLAAVPVAMATIWRGRRGADGPEMPLLVGFYLAWLGQAVALQHLFDYVHVPPILLGLAVIWIGAAFQKSRDGERQETLANHGGETSRATRRLDYATAFALFCLIWCYPALCAQRIAAWLPCVTDGSTATVRDRVTILHRVNWGDLAAVAGYVREQRIGDGELTSFSLPTVALYGELDLRPSTRYVLFQDHWDIFFRRRPVIASALADSRQKYVVCDLGRYRMQRLRERLEDVDGARLSVTPQPRTTSRTTDRLVYRAGNYVVLRLSGGEMPAWLAENFEEDGELRIVDQ